MYLGLYIDEFGPFDSFATSYSYLVGDTHNLQLVIEDVYKAEVHVFIYGHTRF